RLTPTVSVAELSGVMPTGSPLTLAPRGMTPPLSRPFGPVPWAGEPALRLNQSHMTCASAHEVKLVVSESCGTCLNSGSALALLPPGPLHGGPWRRAMRLLV